jgi:hypothetical protein
VSERVPVLYIGGAGRSGSTLVELMLAQAPDVTGLGEVVHLWRRGVQWNELCGCRQPFHDCPFWSSVGQQAFGGWGRVDSDRMLELARRVDRQRYAPLLALPRRPPGFSAAAAEYTDTFRRVYRAAGELTGGLTVDSSKHPSLAFLLATDPGVALRVVHLVRDSRGVAFSWRCRVVRPERVAGPMYMRRLSAANSAVSWAGTNALFGLLATAGTPTLRVRYEDVVAEPAGTVAAIRRFAGLAGDLPEATAFLSQGADRPARTLHSVAGNPLRFADAPLRLRPDVAWRAEMPARDRLVVTALTAPLALRYGYRLR